MDANGKKTEDELREEAIRNAEKNTGEFDKERQRADQAEANARKLLAERNQRNTEFATLHAQLLQQQQQIKELSGTKQVLDSIPEVDAENASVEDLVKVVGATKKIIAEQAKKLAALEGKAQQFEKIETNRSAQTERNTVLEKVCAKLEAEFGSGLRNDAIALMQKTNEEEGNPENSAEATLRLRDCFSKVKQARDAEKKKANPSPIPPGEGGGRSSFRSPKFTKGSLKEVLAQARKGVGAS